ncbi:MAG: peptide ABC transporter substrate-binding protein [Armatimonadetes bacterium]|nr:peptide ABC transporter substrate-binding protein [Armatimonadota bacterium]
MSTLILSPYRDHFRRVAAPMLAALAALTFLSGCATSTRPKGDANTGTTASAQTLRYPLLTEPTTMDPARVEDGPTIDVLQHLYDGLVQWNEKNEVVPNLAESWTVSPDGRVYTFKLKQGVKFHNGDPVTAQDFVYSINRALDPKTQSTVAGTYLNDILGAEDVLAGKAQTAKGVEAVGDHTLRITLDQPKAYFLSKLTYPTAYAVSRRAIEEGGDRWTEKPVGTGPFILDQWAHHSMVRLRANPDYHEGRPKLDGIERPILLDTRTRHSKFENGELHMTDVTMGDYDRDKNDPKLKDNLKIYPRPAIFYVSMNQKAFPPFQKKQVRQAFNHAVDKDTLIRVAMRDVPKRANGILPPGIPGYDPNLKGLEYNPEKARQLLAEAGYPGGKGFPALTLTFREKQADMRRFAEAMADQLEKNLGIQVSLREMEWGSFLDARNKGELPFYYLRWMADYLDPQDFLSIMLRTGTSENGANYSNPEFDRLVDQADVMQDPQKRIELYRKAERIAVDDAAWIPLYFQTDVELWNPAVKGVRESLMGHLPHKQTYLDGPN